MHTFNELIDKMKANGIDLTDYMPDIEKVRRERTFGLVWEDRPEAIEHTLNTHFPVLSEVEDRRITSAGPANALIEGDNLEALIALKNMGKKVDVIYIDPPYNTGNEFIYNDKLVDKQDAFRHSAWLSFMSKRLKLARQLMNDDGVIFVSIDDNEQAHLKLLMDQIFGEENFVSQMIWRKKTTHGRGSKYVIPQTEYILIYSKNIYLLKPFLVKDSNDSRFKMSDDKGRYYLAPLEHSSPKGAYERKTLQYTLNLTGEDVYCSTGQWLWSSSRMIQEYKQGNLVLSHDKSGRLRAYKKIRQKGGITPLSYIEDSKMTNTAATINLKDILTDISTFNYPKPVLLISHLISMHPNKNAVVLDFFAGSGTTGHAVAALNKEDGGNRQFILCTNNENGICENVTYERLRRVSSGDWAKGPVEPLPLALNYFRTELRPKSDRDTVDAQIIRHILGSLKVYYGVTAHTTVIPDRLYQLETDSAIIYVYDHFYVDQDDLPAPSTKKDIIYVDQTLILDEILLRYDERHAFKEITG